MPDIANVLKAEISRLSRKELRAETQSLKKAVTGYRHELAQMKRRMDALERQLKSALKGVGRSRAEAKTEESPDADGRQLRFSPTRLASQRQKLGLSAADFALLLGVSSLSVYKWEHGQARPRRKQLEAIAAARNLGKREALQRLEVLKVAGA